MSDSAIEEFHLDGRVDGNPCKRDLARRHEALRDCGVSEPMGDFTRRIEFHVGYDHRAFPDACGGGGHGQHGMGLAFLLLGPLGAVQWKVSIPGWTPRPVSALGNLEAPPTGRYGPLDLIYATDLGHHWSAPTCEGEMAMECEYIEGGKCFYDGSGLRAGPVLEKFLANGPHGVWAELAREYAYIAAEVR